MAYLDDTGLAYFWGKIKAWANSVFALLGHTHPSSDVTLMTGYSKPASGSAIAASDTLNQAVGKLEAKADAALDDSGYVHKTGDELVQGVKEFKNAYSDDSGAPAVTNSHSIVLRTDKFRKGSDLTALVSNDFINLIFQDNSGSLIDHDGRLGSVEYSASTTGAYSTRLSCFKNSLSDGSSISLTLGYDANGIAYATAPATSTSRTNATDIATRGWVDTNVVHKTGNETIADVKTFTSNISVDLGDTSGNPEGVKIFRNNIDISEATRDNTTYTALVALYDANTRYVSTLQNGYTQEGNVSTFITARKWVNNAYTQAQFSLVVSTEGNMGGVLNCPLRIQNSSPLLLLCDADVTKGNNPSANNLGGVLFVDATNTSSESHRIGSFEGYVDTSGNTHMMMRAYNWVANDTTQKAIAIHYPKNGTAYTEAPTPVDNDNTTKIATTAWVQKFCGTTKGYLTSHASLSVTNSGSGNAVTSITVSGHAITVTKGSTFLTSHQSLANYALKSGTDTITISGLSTTFVSKATGFSIATQPSSTTNMYIAYKDSANRTIGAVQYHGASDVNGIRLMLRKNKDTTTADSSVYSVGLYNEWNSSDYYFAPIASTIMLGHGSGSNRWKQLFATTTTISTSDERVKEDVSPVPDAVLDSWEKVDWIQFKFKDAVSEKGSGARLHNGLIAQAIRDVFAADGLDLNRYGLLCHDEWDARESDDGTFVPAGDLYSLRYEEALCMEAAYMRRENARLKKRVSDLEDRLAALELRLGSE